MTDLKIAIAGLGTVGCGFINLLNKNGALIDQRSGRKIVITHVNARSRDKDRGVDLSPYEWLDNAVDLANTDADVIVELIGGSGGTAFDLVLAALKNGKHVVTANKALMAHHGKKLSALADDNNVTLAYEAAVAGGIPIIKTLREGFAGNQINTLYGILNGTCNYILTEMRETGRDFDDVLKDAQDLGYAEADPAFDIEGTDAAHKLSLLSAIAFGQIPDFTTLSVEGITNISSDDIQFADSLGMRIKLLGVARRLADGGLTQRVAPCLVAKPSVLGNVEGVLNAVYIESDQMGQSVSTGAGAGAAATASSVAADIIDIARSISVPAFNLPAEALDKAVWADMNAQDNHYYLRIHIADKTGMIAEVASILSAHNISIDALTQRSADEAGESVPVMFTTHLCHHGDMMAALEEIEAHQNVCSKPCLMTIETL